MELVQEEMRERLENLEVPIPDNPRGDKAFMEMLTLEFRGFKLRMGFVESDMTRKCREEARPEIDGDDEMMDSDDEMQE